MKGSIAWAAALLVLGGAPAYGQSGNGAVAVETTAPAAKGEPADPLTNITATETNFALEETGAKDSGNTEYLRPMPTPILLGLLAAFGTLIASVVAAYVALFVTPKTLRDIAEKQATTARDIADMQAELARQNLDVASRSAEAATSSARAAALNADAATRNATNTGLHQVARLRQEWINTLRVELAELHSALMNWVPLPEDAPEQEKAAQDAAAKITNARYAKVRLLLNPREVASRRLLGVLRILCGPKLTVKKRMWLCRWLIRWSQIVLKTEWDRVRCELQGLPPPAPRRRGDRR